jgi:hypothetical protein
MVIDRGQRAHALSRGFRRWTLRSSELRVAARDDLPTRTIGALTKFIRSGDLSSSELRHGRTSSHAACYATSSN